MEMTLESLRTQVLKFSKERDWDQFHSPKNLAISVSVEASELLEHFMWMSPEQSASLTKEQLDKISDEVGDVLICLVNFAAKVGIDPLQAAAQKIKKNHEKYPVEKARGSAKKYDEL
jgi:NTP pyrophosphatase (non-canonical NTP hydrolase)